jgi:transcriptional regulator with XRE-family HTH domain
MFRLKELRLENGIKRSKLAQDLNINAGTIANYENEIRQAPYEYLIKFADYFDVSIDYLLGRENDCYIKTPKATNLSYDEMTLISNFRSLDKTAKERTIEYIELWKK